MEKVGVVVVVVEGFIKVGVVVLEVVEGRVKIIYKNIYF